MLTLTEFKLKFNEKEILTPLEKATKKILDGVGAYCRTVAKNSMIDMFIAKGNVKDITKRDRKLKKAGFNLSSDGSKASKPGAAAFSKLGYIKANIYFFTDMKERDVVIGPAKLAGVKSEHAVEVLEHGGIEQIFLGGPRKRIAVTAQYQPRPTMHLAMEKTIKKKMPDLIRGGLMREA